MRFQAGETIEQIALKHMAGKSIRLQTVIGYLLKALEHGRELDLPRLMWQSTIHQCGPPSCHEWAQLLRAEAAAAIDVATVETVRQVELLKTFLPAAEKAVGKRTEAEKAAVAAWHEKARWFVVLRRLAQRHKEATRLDLRSR